MTSLERLTQAGLVEPTHQFDQDEKDAIESLTSGEVEALISSKEKLGEDFINEHVPHGMMF